MPKGPLATATAAAARVGSAWAHAHNVRLVVVGAVEEEAASSKGARFIRDRFDGVHEPVPAACIIGEPSGWGRVTLGYKGRIVVEMEAVQPMAHTAGPDAGVATVAVDFWNWVDHLAAHYNAGIEKTFDQLSPSLRRLATFTDELMHDHVVAQAGIRLPLGTISTAYAAFTGQRSPPEATHRALDTQHATHHAPRTSAPHLRSAGFTSRSGPLTTITLRLSAYEVAWRSERNNALVRSFLGRSAGRCGGEAWVRGQERHQRHERGRPGLALPDPGLRAGRQQPGSHAP